MYNLRQISTTGYPITFPMFSNQDHINGVTGLTPSVVLSKNGTTFVNASGSVSEIGNGWYALAGHVADRSSLGELVFKATANNADSFETKYTIVPFDPFDSVRLGLTSLPNASAGASFGLPINDAIIFGSVSSAPTTTGFLGDSGLSATDNIYQNAVLAFTSSSFASMQAGEKIAMVPQIAPIADVVMQTSGWRQPSPGGQDPNFPMPQNLQVNPSVAGGSPHNYTTTNHQIH